MTNYKPFPLEPKVIEIIKNLYDIKSNEEAGQPEIVRDFMDKMSASGDAEPVEKQDLEIEFNKVKVEISILRPIGSENKILPVIMFIHGGGWVFGSYNSHRILTNQLVNLLGCCVIFVNYSFSPEVKYPVALEECYATLCWIQQNAASIYITTKGLVICGDSAGGNLSTSLTILCKQRGNTGITYQVLFYPVLDIDFETESYIKNQDNLFLPRNTMKYVWDAYIGSKEHYTIPTAVPMSSDIDLLQDLPPALIITAEKDVLRTEGELYAKKLSRAGVTALSVCYGDIGHGFLTMPFFKPQTLAAISQTVDIIRKHWSLKSKI